MTGVMPAAAALVVGESLVDVVRRGEQAEEHVGGSAANVALALARLGTPTTLVTRVADDERGRRIVSHLERDGVALVTGSPPAERTATAVATLDETGAAAYDFDLRWDLPPVVLPGGLRPAVVHACSLAVVLEPGCEQVYDVVAGLRDGAVVSYDVNLRPVLTGTGAEVVARVERMAGLADLVKASDEDLVALYGTEPLDGAARLLSLGPGAVVVTRGADGATWCAADDRTDVAARPTTVVDTVAAGDTFGAALLVGLADRGLLVPRALGTVGPTARAEVLGFAAAAAGVVVARAGAAPPYRHELP